jgi:fatty acid synthase
MMSRLPPRVGDNLEPLVLRSIGLDQVKTYAEASGDRNPIHLSPAAAAAAGLDGPVVHGMFIMGQCERLLRGWRPCCGIDSLTIQFLRPLEVGGFLEVAARIVSIVSENSCRLRLTARNAAGLLIAAGEATVSYGR